MNLGINGFGRIGRSAARIALLNPKIKNIHVNDLGDIQTLSHLFKYDSIHNKLPLKFSVKEKMLLFENEKTIFFSSKKDPETIPWMDTKTDIVLECTGKFLTYSDSKKHLLAGCKKVILSAPSKSENIPNIVFGINDNLLKEEDKIISNASCTTNNAASMLWVLKKITPIESASITTIHSYTSDQKIHDSPHKDLRRARSAGVSIIPTTTGAAKTIGDILPSLKGKIKGSSFRVPVANGSITEITIMGNKEISKADINNAMKEAAKTELKNILSYTEEPLVSSDIIGLKESCLCDGNLTQVNKGLIKVVGWYDNEIGYSNRLIDLAMKINSF